MISLPAFLSSKAFGYAAVAALVIGYTGAVFYAGTQSAGKAHEKAHRISAEEALARSQALVSARAKELEHILKAAQARATKAEARNQGIRDVTITAIRRSDPNGFVPSEPERMRINEDLRNIFRAGDFTVAPDTSAEPIGPEPLP